MGHTARPFSEQHPRPSRHSYAEERGPAICCRYHDYIMVVEQIESALKDRGSHQGDVTREYKEPVMVISKEGVNRGLQFDIQASL